MKIAIGLYICLLLTGNAIGMVLMGLMAASSHRSRCEECRFLSRQGEWVEIEEDWRKQMLFWECSECGQPTSTAYNFCPNCGARMKGADDE